jgi:glycosyltransferase involved in cell wall biosynthesis
MQPIISVITCAHNPRQNYLDKVLDALKAQTLSLDQWEFLLIDNASDRPLAAEIDLSWHPHARHIQEETLGLTPARLRGIQEAQADLLIFVDDDNVLDSDYLEVALHISKQWTMLGAWGGEIRGEFEHTPPDWTVPYLICLGIRELERDQWSNLLHQHETTPCGAGICVRRNVAYEYAELVQYDSKRAALDRKGKTLTSCGDTDLAFTACDIGLGTGLFKSLKLTHLIPPNRLQEDYLLNLIENMEYSHKILDSLRGKMPQVVPVSWQRKLLRYYQLWRMQPQDRRFYQAQQRGLSLAIQEIQDTKQLH